MANQGSQMILMRSFTKKLNNAIQEMRFHYIVFGFPGTFLVAKARLLGRQVEVSCTTPSFPYNVHLRLRTSDIAVFLEALVDSQYQWEYPVCPRTIVDVGANIGLSTILYANKYPKARILAVEPEPSNFEMLKKNTEPYSNITAVRAALWKEDCDLQIFDPTTDSWGFWGFRMREFEESQELAREGSLGE